MSTSIEWTRNPDGTKGMTWNPTVGCAKVSPGCDHCYAVGVAHRGMQPAHVGLTIKRPGERPDWTGEVRCLPDRLDTPLRRPKPTTWFVDSMSDLFHPDVPGEFVQQVWDTMADTPQHTYQVLTKRPQRMAAWANRCADSDPMCGQCEPLPNVWLGTSIESDRYTWRADHLRRTPAAVRFLSLEPLLGPLPSLDLTGIDWVIVGGESGPGARPMHPDWARDIRDRCADAGVPFLFKQWGAWSPHPDSKAEPDAVVLADGRTQHQGDECWAPEMLAAAPMARVGKKRAGRLLDGRTWDEMPDRTAVAS